MSVVPGARLVRRKHLGTSAGIDLLSTAIGAIIAVAMAWFGGGAWSLAAQYVATFASRAILLNMAAFHLPELRFSFEALYSHLVSGGIMVACRSIEASLVQLCRRLSYLFALVVTSTWAAASPTSPGTAAPPHSPPLDTPTAPHGSGPHQPPAPPPPANLNI